MNMTDELVDLITSMTTYDPDEEYKILINRYNTQWSEINIDKYLMDAYSRYKNYKININLTMYPGLLNNIDKFIQICDTNYSLKKRELFDLTKKIDKQILKLIEE